MAPFGALTVEQKRPSKYTLPYELGVHGTRTLIPTPVHQIPDFSGLAFIEVQQIHRLPGQGKGPPEQEAIFCIYAFFH